LVTRRSAVVSGESIMPYAIPRAAAAHAGGCPRRQLAAGSATLARKSGSPVEMSVTSIR
jgi:hypothetical protein